MIESTRSVQGLHCFAISCHAEVRSETGVHLYRAVHRKNIQLTVASQGATLLLRSYVVQVLGSTETASAKFFKIPGKILLRSMITYRKMLTHLIRDERFVVTDHSFSGNSLYSRYIFFSNASPQISPNRDGVRGELFASVLPGSATPFSWCSIVSSSHDITY